MTNENSQQTQRKKNGLEALPFLSLLLSPSVNCFSLPGVLHPSCLVLSLFWVVSSCLAVRWWRLVLILLIVLFCLVIVLFCFVIVLSLLSFFYTCAFLWLYCVVCGVQSCEGLCSFCSDLCCAVRCVVSRVALGCATLLLRWTALVDVIHYDAWDIIYI